MAAAGKSLSALVPLGRLTIGEASRRCQPRRRGLAPFAAVVGPLAHIPARILLVQVSRSLPPKWFPRRDRSNVTGMPARAVYSGHGPTAP